MTCERCSSVPELKFNGKSVYVFSSVEDLRQKIEVVLKEKNYHTTNFKGGIEIEVECFESLINSLGSYKGLTTMEHSDIQILPLNGESLDPSELNNIKTLKMWISIIESKELMTMLETNSFTTYFQPIVVAGSQEVYGHETLIRGVMENGKIMAPDQMFKMARDSSLVFNLDRQAREINITNADRHKLDSKIFINFTPTAIYDPEFCLRSTMAKVKEYNISPERIVFEVIETEEVSDINHLKKILEYYRKEGFQIALDDLGSGYASLNKLFNLKPDYIKVDMDIVRDIHKDTVKQSIFKAIIAISKDSGIKTIAEGIETKEELDYVISEGANLIQGYYYSKPMDIPFKF